MSDSNLKHWSHL